MPLKRTQARKELEKNNRLNQNTMELKEVVVPVGKEEVKDPKDPIPEFTPFLFEDLPVAVDLFQQFIEPKLDAQSRSRLSQVNHFMDALFYNSNRPLDVVFRDPATNQFRPFKASHSEIQQFDQLDKLKQNISDLLTKLTKQELDLSNKRSHALEEIEHSCGCCYSNDDDCCQVSGVLSIIPLALLYLGLLGFFISQIYIRNEYHVERNATICADIFNNHTKEALEQFSQEGCNDVPQTFILTSVLFGVLFGIGGIPLFALCIGLIAPVIRDTMVETCNATVEKCIVVDPKISKKEWMHILKQGDAILTFLEQLFPDGLELSPDERKTVRNLNKNKLPLTTLKTTMQDTLTLVKNKQLAFYNFLSEKHRAKPAANLTEQKTVNKDVVIDIPPRQSM